MRSKTCSICKISKKINLFHKDKTTVHGRDYRCIECRKLQRTKHNVKFRNNILKFRYNITVDDYNKLFKKQKGLCRICRESETLKYKDNITNLSVDHCHKTGKVRGLLCRKCNKAIGLFKENVHYLKRVIKYLEVK